MGLFRTRSFAGGSLLDQVFLRLVSLGPGLSQVGLFRTRSFAGGSLLDQVFLGWVSLGPGLS